MKRKIYETEQFFRNFKKLPLNIRARFYRQFRKLENVDVNPYSIGKPLGSRWLRELKQDKYRVYFYVEKTKITILLVDVSDKKHQQRTIDILKADFQSLKENKQIFKY